MKGGILITLGDSKVKNHTHYWTPDQWRRKTFFKGCNLIMACVSTFALKFLGKNLFWRDSTNTMTRVLASVSVLDTRHITTKVQLW